jgi:hypothetical protein
MTFLVSYLEQLLGISYRSIDELYNVNLLITSTALVLGIDIII